MKSFHHRIAHRVAATSAFVLGAALLAGCGDSKQSVTAPATPGTSSAPAQSGSVYDTVAAKGAGFTVGNMMAARVVYVFFDPQCPHCGFLWRASKPVLGQVRMVWMPVRLLSDISARQGAALLASAHPAEDMDKHEASLEAKQGGMVPPANLPKELTDKVQSNTNLMSSIGGGAVPYIVYKNPAGQSAVLEGATDTEGLKRLLNL